MRTILIDLIDTQGTFKGSGVYIRKVFLTLLKTVEGHPEYADVHFVCTYDFNRPILYPDFSIEALSANPRITVVDIAKITFPEVCRKYAADTLFLGLGQQLYYYDFTGIKARTICVLHDLYDLELTNTRLYSLVNKNQSWSKRLRALYDRYCTYLRNPSLFVNRKHPYQAHIRYFRENPDYVIVTVSDFSYHSILHYLPFDQAKIQVLWSPEKECPTSRPVENDKLKDLMRDQVKYLLVVSANRELKNPAKAVEGFLLYAQQHPQDDLYLVTIGYGRSLSDRHIDLPYLSDSDIEHAYQNCYALLYPSLFEGFGYPPLEVMKYSKPVLSSNVCSMPEILQEAPIWFSPFFVTDIYKAIDTFMQTDYEKLCQQSYARYLEVSERQRADLAKLVGLILS